LWPLEVAAGDPEEPEDPVHPAARTAAATQLATIPRAERPRAERLGVERVGVERLDKRTVAPLSPAALKGNRSKVRLLRKSVAAGRGEWQ
jgi:hypothetical protein